MARMSKRKRLLLRVVLGIAVAACLSVVYVQLDSRFGKLNIGGGLTRSQAIALAEVAKTRPLELVTAQPRSFDSRAIVLLPPLYRLPGATRTGWASTGFAIGDGTLIATAFHCVEICHQMARNGVLARPLVISPYYGDVFEAEIVAVDRDADLAILRAPWASHPAFALANDAEFMEAKELAAVGRPASRMGRLPALETIPVLKLDPASKSDTYVVGAVRHAGPGWSGAPMVLPGSGKVAGILTTHHLRNIEDQILFKDLSGCGAPVIRSLLENEGLTEGEEPTENAGPSLPDAELAFSAIMDSLKAMRKADLEQATERAAELVRLRPRSHVSKILYAWFAELWRAQLARKGEEREFPAEEAFRQAVELAPRSAMARAFLGQFLHHEKRYDEALEHLRAAEELDPDLAFASIIQMQVFRETSPAKAEREGRRFVEERPECAELWLELALSLRDQEKHAEAAETAHKALDLGLSSCRRASSACMVAYRGHPDEAEKHIRLIAEEHDCEICWFSLAKFLADHWPNRAQEALEALEKAEAHINPGSGLPEPFQALRQKLEAPAN